VAVRISAESLAAYYYEHPQPRGPGPR
jgi:hypothetical protein